VQLLSLLRPYSNANAALDMETMKLERLKEGAKAVSYEHDLEDAHNFARSLAKNYGVVAFHHGEMSDDPYDPGRVVADMFEALDIKARWVDVQADITLPSNFKEEDGPQVWVGGGAVGDFVAITDMAKDGTFRALLEKHKISYSPEKFAIFEKA